MRTSFARSGALAALFLLATACSDATASRRGNLSILLTDAPGDLVTAMVTIDQIYLQGSPAGGGGRVVLRDDDVTVDLLTLANSTATLVEDADVPEGRYSQLRFVISGAYIEVEQPDGSTRIYASSSDYAGLPAGAQVHGTLQRPSYASSGVKLKLPGGSVQIEGDQKILLVDFDVSRSFGRQAGNSGGWVMSPVLEATEFSTSGSVLVTLTRGTDVVMPVVDDQPLGLATFSAVLANDEGSEEVLALTDTNGDGVYEAQFRYVLPGAYTLDLRTSAAGVTFTTNVDRPKAITVGGSSATAHPFVLTSATK